MVLDGDFRNGLYEKEEKMRILWNEGITEGKKGYERIYFGVNQYSSCLQWKVCKISCKVRGQIWKI